MSRPEYADEARDEIRDAYNWYERKRTGLGVDFFHQVEAAVARIVAAPSAFPQYGETRYRRARLKRFPYTVYFEEMPGGVWIVAVKGDGEEADTWLNRTPPHDRNGSP